MQTLTAKNVAASNPTGGLFAKVTSFFAVIGAAIRASAAVNARRAPTGTDLRTLGIDPKAFTRY